MGIELRTKTVANVFNAVKRQFGDESGVQITDEDILRWINAAQLEIVSRNAELNTATAILNSVENQADYALVEQIPDIFNIQSIHFRNRKIPNLTFQEAEDRNGSFESTADAPEYWFTRNGIVTFYPAFAGSEESAIKVYYNKRPTDVSTTSDLLSVGDNYYNSVINFCMKQAYLLDENGQLATLVGTDFDNSVMLMQQRTQPQNNHYPYIQEVDY